MDIKELNKTQLVLLTLLITFVVSIATGIVTVSLMQQIPKSVPQTINNVIQRTIEKVSTLPTTPTPVVPTSSKDMFGQGDVLVSIYSNELPSSPALTTTPPDQSVADPKPLGQGIIISDVGLILVDSSILTDKDVYRVMLNKTNFDATVLKKYSNGFTILRITPKSVTPVEPKDIPKT
jgi:hypothetical protein